MNHKNDFVMPSEEELRKRLTPEQFNVTQCDATEPPFQNAYWDNYEEGIYVDIISGIPLFSSTDKYDSGTGWPSFTKPIDNSSLKTVGDETLRIHRTEVRSVAGNSHLGHVFEDGPKDQGGLRYCTNSASLRFVRKADMQAQGYGDFLYLFN